MDKLQELISKCKCSVSVTVNEHRDYYETAQQYVTYNDMDETPPEVIAEMIRLDIIVRVQYYPNTPVSFNFIYHYDLDKALDMALEDLNNF